MNRDDITTPTTFEEKVDHLEDRVCWVCYCKKSAIFEYVRQYESRIHFWHVVPLEITLQRGFRKSVFQKQDKKLKKASPKHNLVGL